jgi:hypothetical protein
MRCNDPWMITCNLSLPTNLPATYVQRPNPTGRTLNW